MAEDNRNNESAEDNKNNESVEDNKNNESAEDNKNNESAEDNKNNESAEDNKNNESVEDKKKKAKKKKGNQKKERKIHEKAKDILKVKNVEKKDGQGEYSSGAEAFATLFNNLVDDVEKKAQKEADKPRYRFVDSKKISYEDFISSESRFGEVLDLENKLHRLNYEVKIIENLECKDVSKSSRYYVKISNLNGVYITFDLLDYQAKIKNFTFNEQDFIENEIAKIVGHSDDEVKEAAKYATDYLAHIMYYRGQYHLTYKKVGWEYYSWDSNYWIFKYDTIYHSRPFEVYGGLPDGQKDGLEECDYADDSKVREWVGHTIKLINKYDYDALILGAGISGLIRQLLPYTKETNININIVGKPASGKSTIGHYLLSIFGNPAKIEGSFTDTDNKMEEIRAKRPVLPYVLDERMLKVATESENRKKQIILMEVFREYEGKVKERLGKQYEESSGERTYGPIISSSVSSMINYIFKLPDYGQYRRFMEFDIDSADKHLLFNGAEEATRTEMIANTNYGIGIRIIIDYMLTLLNIPVDNEEKSPMDSEPTLIRNRFQKINAIVIWALKEREKEEAEKRKKEKRINNAVGLASSSSRFALIILSYQILRESLLYYCYNTNEVESDVTDIKEISEEERNVIEHILDEEKKDIKFREFINREDFIVDKSYEILEILINNLVNKMDRIQKKAQDYENAIYRYIIKNRDYFMEGETFEPKDLKELLESKGDKLGFCTINEVEQTIKLRTVYTYCLPQFWYMEEIPSPDIIKRFIKEIIEKKSYGKDAIKYGSEKYYTKTCNLNSYPFSDKKSIKDEYGVPVKYHELIVKYIDEEEGESE